LPAFLLVGLGAGTSFMPLLSIAMTDVPDADAGLGSGSVNVSMQMAAALGLAILGTIATDRTRSLAASGRPAAVALSGGYQLAFLIAAVCAGVGTVVAVLVLTGTRAGEEDPAALRRVEVENAGEPLAT
ncbi:MAG: MFS transporter, partial [Acidimicrobiales bacterium]